MRTGCPMPRVAEEQVLAARRRDAVVTATVLALTAVAFAVVADHGLLAHIQRADDAWLRLMISGRAAPVSEPARDVLLPRGQHVDDERPDPLDQADAAAGLTEADQHEHRVKRYRRERINRHAVHGEIGRAHV